MGGHVEVLASVAKAAISRFLTSSDVPMNTIYKWKEGDSISIFLRPSGYTGAEPKDGETGSNGLLLDPNGRLVLCQHGNRQVAWMDAPFEALKSNSLDGSSSCCNNP